MKCREQGIFLEGENCEFEASGLESAHLLLHHLYLRLLAKKCLGQPFQMLFKERGLHGTPQAIKGRRQGVRGMV